MKFKKGDKVINKTTGEEDVVVAVPGDKKYDSKGFLSSKSGFWLKNNLWEFRYYWKLLKQTNVKSKR